MVENAETRAYNPAPTEEFLAGERPRHKALCWQKYSARRS